MEGVNRLTAVKFVPDKRRVRLFLDLLHGDAEYVRRDGRWIFLYETASHFHRDAVRQSAIEAGLEYCLVKVEDYV